MIWLFLAISLIIGLTVGFLGAWMTFALCSMGHDYEQRILIIRLKSVLRGFLTATEQYHDDLRLANVGQFARQLLGEEV